MKSVTMKMLCRILVLAMLSLSFHTAHAGLIGTQQAATAATVQADRALVLSALSRAEVSSMLQAQGLDPEDARARVATMTNGELSLLADGIRNAPAGADGAFLVAVAIGVGIWYVFFRR